MDLWNSLRKCNGEVGSHPKNDEKFAVFFLSTASCSSLQARNASMFERVAKQAEWEVSFGDSLSEIPRKLVSKVSDYKLIVIYIASNDIAESNLAFLKALSPQFPFLVLLDDNERFESQCVIVRNNTQVKGSLVFQTLLEWSDPRSLFSVTSVGSHRETCSIQNEDQKSATVQWKGAVTRRVRFSAVITAPGYADGKYVGGLLKSAILSSKIRLLVEKYSSIIVHFDNRETSSVESIDVRLTGLCSANGLTQIQKIMVSQRTVVIGVKGSDVERACMLLSGEALGKFPSVFVGQAFRFEVAADIRVFLLMEGLVRAKVADSELGIRIEDVSLPDVEGADDESRQTNHLRQVSSEVPQPPVPQQPLMNEQKIDYSYCDQLEQRLLTAIDQRERRHQDELRALRQHFENAISDEKSKHREELMTISQQLAVFRNQAADHSLVEAALSELKVNCASRQSLAHFDERLDQLVASITEVKELVTLQQLRVNSLVSQQPELMRSVEDLLRWSKNRDDFESLGKSLLDVETRQRELETYCSTYHHAFETAADRLFTMNTEVAAAQSVFSGWRDHQQQCLLELQQQMVMVDTRLKDFQHVIASAGNQQQSKSLSEQFEAARSYCTALCDRVDEVQKEKMAQLEKKLSAEYRQVVAEIQKRVESSNKIGSQISVEELDLCRMQTTQMVRVSDDLRSRVGELERAQSEVSGLLEFEESRVQQLTEIRRRIDTIESRVKFLEARSF